MKPTILTAALLAAACGGTTADPTGPYVVSITGQYGSSFACNGRVTGDVGAYQATFACREMTQVGVAWMVTGAARTFENRFHPDELQLLIWQVGRVEEGQPDLAVSLAPGGTGNAAVVVPWSGGAGVIDCVVTWERDPS